MHGGVVLGAARVLTAGSQAIRVFVEAVLRFGLPVSFVAAVLRVHAATVVAAQHHPDSCVAQPRRHHDKKLRAALKDAYAHLTSAVAVGDDKDASSSSADAAAAAAGGLAEREYYPYVFVDCPVSQAVL